MRQLWITVLLVACAVAARADSIPVYDLTQGAIIVTNASSPFPVDAFSFSNGNGVTIGGIDRFPLIGMSIVGGGSAANPFLLIGLNLDTSNVNGQGLFLFGSVTITGADFLLPTTGSTYSVTVPVLFSGSFSSCQGTYGPFGGCNPPPTFLGTFNINGPGTVSLTFLGIPLGGGGTVWQLTGATYALNSVPEPASILLLGTGVIAVCGKVRRRRFQRQETYK